MRRARDADGVTQGQMNAQSEMHYVLNSKRCKTSLIPIKSNASVNVRDVEIEEVTLVSKDQNEADSTADRSLPMQTDQDRDQVNPVGGRNLQTPGNESEVASAGGKAIAEIISKLAHMSDGFPNIETDRHLSNLFQHLRERQEHSAKAVRDAEENALHARREMQQAAVIVQHKTAAFQASCRKRIADLKEQANYWNTNMGKTLDELHVLRNACTK